MTTLSRIRLNFGGAAVVGPSVSTFYTSGSATSAVAALHTFYIAISNRLPDKLTWSFAGTGDLIDSNTGLITGSYTLTPPTAWAGSDTGLFVQGVGGRIAWQTATVANGRRVRGSTFVVPMATSSFAADGMLGVAAIAPVNTAISTLLTTMAGALQVFSRPGGTHATGGNASITSGAMPRAVSTLRSRRT